MNGSNLLQGITEWQRAEEGQDVPTGLAVKDALRQATWLRRILREGGPRPTDLHPGLDLPEALQALCAILTESVNESPEDLLRETEEAFAFAAEANWGPDPIREKQETLSRLAFLCWRNARRAEIPAAERHWLGRFGDSVAEASAVRFSVEQILATSISERADKPAELHLDDPETLLCLLDLLPKRYETLPATVLEEASFLYGYLEKLEVRQPHDPIIHDEKEYFLGETARLAGAACRFLSRRDEAREWLDLSEAWFLAAENAAANIARLAYQRLALRTEEREFAAVLKLIPHLVANFERLGMFEDGLKTRFLHATVLKEIGQVSESTEAFRRIIDDARALRVENLLPGAYVSLVQGYGFLGDLENARACAEQAAPLLRASGNRLLLGKLQWSLGHLLRVRGQLEASIGAFRESQQEFQGIGMHADVAAVHLVLADLLLDAGQPAQAEWEIRAALPIIEEYKLVPEGIAAYSLLRDSLRRRQIDRQALRNLHGYFRSDEN